VEGRFIQCRNARDTFICTTQNNFT